VTSPEAEAVLSALDDCGAWMAFLFVLILPPCLALLALLFGGLGIYKLWRWLVVHSWGDVVRSAGRKALDD